MNEPEHKRNSLLRLIQEVDEHPEGAPPSNTIPTGFASLDKVLGGGLRKQDLAVLGGDVGSGKSALALAMAARIAHQGFNVAFFSGEMDESRLLERLLAIEGKATIDDIRQGTLSDGTRATVGAAALRFKDLPLTYHAISYDPFEQTLGPAWPQQPDLVVVDYLQLLAPPTTRMSLEEEHAASLRALKSVALERNVACLAVSQLPNIDEARADRRPILSDFGASGAVKQHADLVLSLYREEMYRADPGVEGAAELIVSKNRHGGTGFVDLYFFKNWMRFEDMLDQ